MAQGHEARLLVWSALALVFVAIVLVFTFLHLAFLKLDKLTTEKVDEKRINDVHEEILKEQAAFESRTDKEIERVGSDVGAFVSSMRAGYDSNVKSIQELTEKVQFLETHCMVKKK